MPRTREAPPRRVVETDPDLSYHWTLKEKKDLAEGIRMYGFGDIHKLVGIVKTKKYEEIQEFIMFWYDRAERKMRLESNKEDEVKIKRGKKKANVEKNEATSKGKKSETTALEFWAQTTSDFINPSDKARDYSEVFADVFRHIANKEKHVKPKNENDPDFKEMYNFIAAVLSGSMTPPKLSSANSAIVLTMLQDMSEFIDKADLSKIRKLMASIDGPVQFESSKDNQAACSHSASLETEPESSQEMDLASSVDNALPEPGPEWTNRIQLSEASFQSVKYHKKIQENLNPLCIPVKCMEEVNEKLKCHLESFY